MDPVVPSGKDSQEGKEPGQPSTAGNIGGLRDWVGELKRRRVFRALVAYGIAGFAVLQIVEPIMHGAHWPEIALS